MANMPSELQSSIQRSAETIGSLGGQVDQLAAICEAVVGALRQGHKVLTAGHGGSAADALHMAEELVGRFISDRQPLPAVSLAGDPTLLTCIGNDFGFEQIFPRQVQALGRPGDVLVVFSTSGQGEGLLRAVGQARARDMITIALLGKGGGALKGQTDHELIVAGPETARIQEAHTLILHLVLEAVEREFAK